MDATELLRSARRRAGLTQREVAARAGVTQPVIAAYESGRRQPTLPMLQKLLAASDAELRLRVARRRRLPDPARANRHLQLLASLPAAVPHRPRSADLAFPRLPSR